MAIPSIRSVGAPTFAQNVSAISMIAGSIVDGDLVLLIAGKDVSSNFTFPAGFTKAVEVGSLAFTAAIGWKWGVAADSGATFVASVNAPEGLGPMMHGYVAAIADVKSWGTPLRGLVTRTNSINYFSTGSHQTDAKNTLVIAATIQSDNISINSADILAQSWTNMVSYGDGTGDDWQQSLMYRSLPDSGTVTAVFSRTTPTAHNYHSAVFGIAGLSDEIYVTQASDALLLIDSLQRRLALNRRHTDTLAVLDSGKRALDAVVYATDAVALVDSAVRRAIRVRLGTDTTLLTDSAIRRLLRTRLASEGVVITDAAGSARISVRQTSDGITLSDGRVKLQLLVRTDSAGITDAALRGMLAGRVASDSVLVGDTFFATFVPGYTVIAAVATDGLWVSDRIDDLWVLRNRRLSELALDLVDSARRAVDLQRTQTDLIAAVDGAFTSLRRAVLASDHILMDEGRITVVSLVRYASDMIEVSDSATADHVIEESQRYVVKPIIGAESTIVIGAR